MPVNEFEKQVQQIMGELRVPPSPPVWENIEEQIRKKKEHRRIIFVVIFFFLILSGGLWLTLGTDHKPGGQQAQLKHMNGGNSSSNNSSSINRSNKEQNAIDKKLTETSDKKNEHSQKQFSSTTKIEQKQAVTKTGRKTITAKRSEIKNLRQEEPTVLAKQQQQEIGRERKEEPTAPLPPDQKEIVQPTAIKDQPVKTELTTDVVKENVETKKTDSLNQTNSITETKSQAQKGKAKTSKWQKQVIAEVGYSDYGYGFFDLGQKSVRFAATGMSSGPPTSSGGQPNPVYLPQEIKKGIAAAVGFELTRTLNNHFAFSVGLQYHYFSQHTKVGAAVKKDSTINYQGDAIAISGYYKNGTQSNYTNNFHVLEIPVSFQYRPFKNFPLEFGLGASYGHLLKTNALSFHNQANIYYRNKKDYRTDYLNIFSSVQYSWLQKAKLSIRTGPVFFYSLTELQRTNSYDAAHLFSVGIRTSIKF